MKITVLYFASLADKAGIAEETLTLEQSVTLPELFEQLSDKYHFSRPQSQLGVAINDNFAEWSDSIQDGDQVAFIPPVAGG